MEERISPDKKALPFTLPILRRTWDDSPLATYEVLFLLVDAQSMYVDCLPMSRQEGFLRAANDFAQGIKPYGISTMRVAWPSDEHPHRDYAIYPALHTPSATDTAERASLLQELGLSGAPVDEGIFLKWCSNPFTTKPSYLSWLKQHLSPSPLAQHLANKQKKALLVGGLFTSQCIRNSVLGAIYAGYPCIVITDLLGDEGTTDHDGNAEWHQHRLEELIRGAITVADKTMDDAGKEKLISMVNFCTSLQFMTCLASTPKMPQNKAGHWFSTIKSSL